MLFYRSIKPFYAITLDLDNTLYNNGPIIYKAEERLILFLKQYHPALLNIKQQDYCVAKRIIKLMDPEIYHDVNNWRWKSLEKILLESGLSKHDAQYGADCAMDIIIYWRNQIIISDDTYRALEALSSRWPLIAITNGNANPMMFGLKGYFNDILWAGVNGRAKPYTDLYFLASKYFDLPCKYILHIGDDLQTDIQGSIQSGVQSCWIRKYIFDQKRKVNFDKTVSPNLEISDLMSLTRLL